MKYSQYTHTHMHTTPVDWATELPDCIFAEG